MTSLIKNQVLKLLSKFTKNLSPDKLQLSAFKGSCEVTNIELNEAVLMDLLELPVWINLTRAHCNYASVKIQWIKLKTIPIVIILDEVTIIAETCEEFRNASDAKLATPTGSYGFFQKVQDGIGLSINSVTIEFSASKLFSASIELSRIIVESRNCKWKPVEDLSKSRIRDNSRGQVLIFKHIEWQTLRFVAKSEATTDIGQAPLRLIANQTSCRIMLKKKLSDSSVLGARIMVIFDDLLWVLTDSQLLSALHFADYLGELMKKAPRKKKAYEGLDARTSQQARAKLAGASNNSPSKMNSNNLTNAVALLFSEYDMVETSHHLVVKRIEIHLMDVIGPHKVKSNCAELAEGGALTITLHRVLVDIYPNHLLSFNRRHWWRWSDPSPNRHQFIQHKIQSFFASQKANAKTDGFNLQQLQGNLSSQAVVIRISDYAVGCVSTNNRNTRNRQPANEAERMKLISFDSSPVLPGNIDPIYVELNSYFYTEPFDKLAFPVPDTTIFAHVAPMKIVFEPLTLLWLNAFFANLHNALIKLKEAFPLPDKAHEEKVNLRAEILMPTIVLKLGDEHSEGLEYSALEVKLSRILLYNCDEHIPRQYYKPLQDLQQRFAENWQFYFDKTSFPWMACDMKSISSQFMAKINRLFASNETIGSEADLDLDFWCLQLEPVWLELRDARNNRCESFLEPLTVRLWLDVAPENAENVDIHLNVLVDIVEPIKVQITHGQLMFLLRLVEKIGDFTATLNYDTYMIQTSHFMREQSTKDGQQNDHALLSFHQEDEMINKIFKKMAVVANIPEINVFLILKREEMYVDVNDSINSSRTSLLSPSSNSSNCNLLAPLAANGSENAIDSAFNETDATSFESGGVQPQKVNGVVEKVEDKNKDDKRSKMPEHDKLSRKMNMNSSLHSFDSTSLRMHYSAAEDDVISSLSDDNDDSDQQSLVGALLAVDCSDAIDELFVVEEGVEAGEEAFNMNATHDKDNSDNTLNHVFKDKHIKQTKSKKLENVYVNVLKVCIKQLNLIQQSSKGFLTQIALNTSNFQLEECLNLKDEDYQNKFRVSLKNGASKPAEKEAEETSGRLTLRIDSFSKGVLRDEMISVMVSDVNLSFNKITVDSVVDFFADPYAEKVAPTAVAVENVQVEIVDTALRAPPLGLQLAGLRLARGKDNKWIVEPGNVRADQLLWRHLKIYQRNLLCNVSDLIREQARLNGLEAGSNEASKPNDDQQVLEQVLAQKDILYQEVELLKKENQELRRRLNLTE